MSEPETTAVPTVVPDVSTAVYVPLLLFVTLPSVPRLVFSASVPPLEVRLLPNSSFNWTVIVEAAAPSAVSEPDDAVTVDVVTLAVPGVNVTDAIDVNELPSSVPEIAAEPAAVEEVNVAEYVPLLLFVTAESVPRVVESAMVPEPVVRLFP